MDDRNYNYRNNRGSNRGNRGNNRGRKNYNRGYHHNNNDDYYFSQVMGNNNNNQKNESNNYKRKNHHNKKHKDDINNLDDYFNKVNNFNKNEIKEEEPKFEENNYEENENIFKKSQKFNKNFNDSRKDGFNDSSKQVKEIKKSFISYNQLKEILENEDDNKLIQFFTKYRDISDVFENTRFTPDMISLMIKLLSKISQINSGPASDILNQIFSNTKFLLKIKEKLREERYLDTKYLETFYDISILCNKLIDKFTDDSKRIKYSELAEFFDVLHDLINNGKIVKDLELALKIVDVLNDFREKEKHKKLTMFEEKQKKIEKEKLEKNPFKDNNKLTDINLIPIDYKQREIQLSDDDFKNHQKLEIASNIIKGSYITYERYINTMFYLEYEDCYRSLRKTINEFQLMGKSINKMDNRELQKATKSNTDIYFYLKGEIRRVDINKDGVILEIEFKAATPRKIKFTKRMITSSLIILTDDNYERYLLTTVYYNPYLDNRLKENQRNKKRKIKIPKHPYYRVQLSLVNINPQSFMFLLQNRKNLQIFESKAYFESYIHVMRRLKEINIPDLPFREEIVNANFVRLEMAHINENYNYRYNNMLLNPAKGTYPKQFFDVFDKSQLIAVHNCLKNKICLIQGPPGTGKTHVGTILTDILLQNLRPKAQILVVCFTNHALDSFIEGLLKYTDDVVRIGGRCKNEIVNQKRLENKDKMNNKVYRGIMNDLDKVGVEMNDITSLMDVGKKVDYKYVKILFNNLLNKIVSDFFYYVNAGFNEMNFDVRNYIKKEAMEDFKRRIYIFWNLIDVPYNKKKKNNFPDDIILDILNNFKLNEGQINLYLETICNNLDGYDKDNVNILNYLNNNKYNDLLNINNNEENKNVEEEEEEDDEEEIQQNLDRLDLDFYLNEIGDKENDKNEIKEISEENDNEFENENGYNEIKRLMPLNDEKFEALINSTTNFFRLGPKVIRLIIDYMKNKILLAQLNQQNNYFNKFNNLLIKKNEESLMLDAEKIKQYKIVAMTTTGAAKYSTILEQNNFEIVIIEEAAEVLESHILSLLTKHTRQLILIGDHKQLRPKPYNYELETKYNFGISMFERLINNGIPYSALKYQRRMKPIFADFVRIIYGNEEYLDYDDVKNKDKVKGMEKDMFIIKHKELETENEGLKSKVNEYEAVYLANLCKYLLLQGYDKNQIVILTFYVGQVIAIRKQLKKLEIEYIRVSSVDNYQGEECDIVLLSLVRSNKKNEIGFLKNFNRVCVAFSRAKIGFYIIGNIDHIVESEKKLKNNSKIDAKMQDVWQKIKQKAEELNIIGDSLTLVCQNHQTKTVIKSPKDFVQCPEGGCKEICLKRLNCGHTCEKLCHVKDCNLYSCLKACERINPNCKYKLHKCNKRCYEDCGRCEAKIDVILPCGHEKKEAICYEDINKIKCLEKCDKILKCFHKCELTCGEDCYSKPCRQIIKVKLNCGHINDIECHQYKDLTQVICQEKCTSILKCGHTCSGTCGRCLGGTLHTKCNFKCGRNLPCGHVCEQKCSSECLCNKDCPNICPHGYCAKKCCEICVDCAEKCSFKCPHSKCNKLCGELCDRKPCDERCNKKMKCGHQCYGLCGERCPEVCRICEPDKECFKEDFFYKCELEDDALLYKTKCGHLFEIHGMDYYFNSQKNIQMFTCPYCKSLLIDEPRYQNLIKNIFKDIQKIKQVSLDKNMGKDDNTFYLKSKEIVDKILYNYDRNIINIFELLNANSIMNENRFNYDKYDLKKNLPVIYNLCKNHFKKPKDINSRKNTTYNLLTLAQKFIGIEYYAYHIKKTDNNKNEELFLRNFHVIKTYFENFEGNFNNFFFVDLKTKIDNMLYYSIIKLNPNKYNNNSPYSNLYFMARNYDPNAKKTPEEIIKGNFSLQLDLKDLFKNTSFDSQAINLLRTLGTQWYKCPNGHLYTVGECGRPMEQSKCPECGQVIGGQNHISARNNQEVNLQHQMMNMNLNNNVINNDILNQDQEALNNMNREHEMNQEHHMDDDIRDLLRHHPEMNEYN